LGEEEVKRTFLEYKNTASMESSASVIFAALAHFNFKKNDKIVFLNSGKTNWK